MVVRSPGMCTLFALVLVACGSPNQAATSEGVVSVGPTASTPAALLSPSPSTLPTDIPTSHSSPTSEPRIEKDTIAEVIVTDLVVRTGAGVGADSEIMEVRLTTGDLVYVIDGPIRVDGYPWLLVAELGPRFGSSAAGWIAAASREDGAWVLPSNPPCPQEVSVEAFASVPDALLLYCFAGQELVLDGALGFCAHGDPVVQEPAWLANYACAFESTEPPEAGDRPMIYVHLPPRLELPPYVGDRLPMRISGRFDAAAAKTCQFAEGAEQSFLRQITKLEEALLAFACRRSFAIEAASPL